MKKIGLINIGDSPITGIEEEKALYLQECEIVEEGALDGLSEPEMWEILWDGAGELLTVERRSGERARLKKDRIIPLLERAMRRAAEKGCGIFYIHCTGFFPGLAGCGPLIRPGLLMRSLVEGYTGKTAVFTPSEEQIAQTERKWKDICPHMEIFAVSPSDYEKELQAMREILNEYGLLILDCASYGTAFEASLKRNGYQGIIMCALRLAFTQCRALAYDK